MGAHGFYKMANIKDRETKKNRLRSQVVDFAAQGMEQGSEGRRSGRTRIFVLIGVFVLLLLLGGGMYITQRRYGSYHVNWSHGFAADGSVADADYVDYALYSGGMVKLTRDGASFVNAAGKTVWNQAYEMRTPIISVNGDYCAVADQGQNQIYIMNASGTTGQAKTTLPIVKISVSAKGVVYALLEDSTASYITVFSKEGVALDISIKSVLGGDGYPVDLSVSPDGTELIVSFAYIENGTVQNKVIFYNLDEVGKNAGTNRVVGGFIDDFKGHLVARVHFSDDSYAQAFYDGGIAFFSTKVLTSPALLANETIEQTIRSVAYNDEYVGVITDNADGEEPYRMMVYRTSGQKVFDKAFNYNYEDFTIDGDRVILSNEETLQLYSMSGALKFDGTLDVAVVKAGMGSGVGTNLLIGSTGSMESVKLK